MSRARHEAHRADGGAAKAGMIPDKPKVESYAGTGSKTEKEAEHRKRGGKVHSGKMPMMVMGKKPSHHGNRPGRKSGGSVGADSHPMTSAANLKDRDGSTPFKLDREDD